MEPLAEKFQGRQVDKIDECVTLAKFAMDQHKLKLNQLHLTSPAAWQKQKQDQPTNPNIVTQHIFWTKLSQQFYVFFPPV